MAYLPPLNGGRANVTIGGNTTGTGSLVSSGTVTWAGGNNITLSQAGGNAITISAASQSAQTQNNIQALVGGTATSTASSGTVTFMNSNGVTFGLSGNTMTASVAAAGAGFAAGVSTVGNSSGMTGTVNNQLVLAGGNNITLSQTTLLGSATVTISAASQSVQTQNLVSVNGSTGNISFNNANNVTFGGNASAITASASFSQSVQSQGIQSVNIGGNTAGAAATISSGAVSLYGGNNITLSQNANSLTVSAGAAGGVAVAGGGATYVSGTANLSAAGGALTIASAAGQAINFSVPATSSLSASGAISISTNGGTISIGAPVQSAQTQSLIAGLYDGVNYISSGTAFFADANNVSLGIVGQSVTASANVPSAIVAGGATASTGTVSFANSNGVNFGLNGNTLTASVAAAAGATLSRWEYPEDVFGTLSTVPNGSLSIQHMYIPFNVTASAAKIGGSLSVGTGTSATTGTISASLWMGLYGLTTGSLLTLLSFGSINNSFAVNNTGATGNNSSVTGMRQFTVPMNMNVTPGEYWMAAAMSTATNYATNTMAFTLYGNNQIQSFSSAQTTGSTASTGPGAAILMPIGGGLASARDVLLFQGIYTAQTSAGPVTMAGSQINNTGFAYVQRAAFYNVIFNATY